MQGWYEIIVHLVIAFTVIVEIYLLWLIVRKTPEKMVPFRFALFLLVLSELCFTVTFGIFFDPDMLVPMIKGALVNGFGRWLGPDGGRIMFTLTLFFGACVVDMQVYCLLYRYTAIQQRYDNLHKNFNRWPVRFGSMLYNLAVMCSCAFFAYKFMDSPEEIGQSLREHFVTRPAIKEFIKEDSVLVVLTTNFTRLLNFGIFVIGGFMFASTVSLGFSVHIYRTIKANAAHFSEHTFKLHRQLTMLLIIQFCLPLFLLAIPVLVLITAAYVILNFPMSKLIGDLSILLLCLYSIANSLCCLFFITPYRNFTLLLLWRLFHCLTASPTVRPQVISTQLNAAIANQGDNI